MSRTPQGAATSFTLFDACRVPPPLLNGRLLLRPAKLPSPAAARGEAAAAAQAPWSEAFVLLTAVGLFWLLPPHPRWHGLSLVNADVAVDGNGRADWWDVHGTARSVSFMCPTGGKDATQRWVAAIRSAIQGLTDHSMLEAAEAMVTDSLEARYAQPLVSLYEEAAYAGLAMQRSLIPRGRVKIDGADIVPEGDLLDALGVPRDARFTAPPASLSRATRAGGGGSSGPVASPAAQTRSSTAANGVAAAAASTSPRAGNVAARQGGGNFQPLAGSGGGGAPASAVSSFSTLGHRTRRATSAGPSTASRAVRRFLREMSDASVVGLPLGLLIAPSSGGGGAGAVTSPRSKRATGGGGPGGAPPGGAPSSSGATPAPSPFVPAASGIGAALAAGGSGGGNAGLPLDPRQMRKLWTGGAGSGGAGGSSSVAGSHQPPPLHMPARGRLSSFGSVHSAGSAFSLPQEQQGPQQQQYGHHSTGGSGAGPSAMRARWADSGGGGASSYTGPGSVFGAPPLAATIDDFEAKLAVCTAGMQAGCTDARLLARAWGLSRAQRQYAERLKAAALAGRSHSAPPLRAAAAAPRAGGPWLSGGGPPVILIPQAPAPLQPPAPLQLMPVQLAPSAPAGAATAAPSQGSVVQAIKRSVSFLVDAVSPSQSGPATVPAAGLGRAADAGAGGLHFDAPSPVATAELSDFIGSGGANGRERVPRLFELDEEEEEETSEEEGGGVAQGATGAAEGDWVLTEPLPPGAGEAASGAQVPTAVALASAASSAAQAVSGKLRRAAWSAAAVVMP